jgi:hypothetical protein
MPLYIDNSTLAAMQTCTTKAALRYLWGYTNKEQRAELFSGQVGHRVLAAYFGGASIAQALTYLAPYTQWAQQNIPTEERLSASNVQAILFAWLQTHPLTSLPYTVLPDLIEVGFQAPLDDNGDIVLVGRLDALVQVRDRLLVLDHKFTGRITETWQGKWHLSSQLSGYVWGARHGTVQGASINQSVTGALINVIELPKLPDNDEWKCRTHHVKYKECRLSHAKAQLLGEFPRDEEFLKGWKADALKLARRYQQVMEEAPTIQSLPSLAQEGTFTNACQWCEFQTICTTPRNPDLVQGMLVHSPWDPLHTVGEVA